MVCFLYRVGFCFVCLDVFFPLFQEQTSTPQFQYARNPRAGVLKGICVQILFFFTIYSNWKFDLKDVKWSAVVYIFNIKFKSKI